MNDFSFLFGLALVVLGVLGDMNVSHAILKTVYREHPPEISVLAETNTGDEVGDSLFILVNIDGAKTNWTPSDEGNPAVDYVSQYLVLYDTRYTGYSSCDKYSDGYHCCCKHERQNHSVACNQQAVGFVDLRDYYYKCVHNGTVQGACTMTQQGCPATGAPTASPASPVHPLAPTAESTVVTNILRKKRAQAAEARTQAEARAVALPGKMNRVEADVPCGWDWGNKCQINLGKKLGSGVSTFSWYSHPKEAENLKWMNIRISGTATAYCVIDNMIEQVAPLCNPSFFNQTIPSKGVYKRGFVQVLHSLYTVLHSLYTVLYSLYTVLHSLYTVLHSLYTVLYSLHTVLHSPYTVLHSLYTVLHSLYTVLHSLHTVLHSLHTVLYSLHTVLYSLHTVLFSPILLVQCFFTAFFGTPDWDTKIVDPSLGVSSNLLAGAWAKAFGTLDGLVRWAGTPLCLGTVQHTLYTLYTILIHMLHCCA
jgi:hypothetical protein